MLIPVVLYKDDSRRVILGATEIAAEVEAVLLCVLGDIVCLFDAVNLER